MLPISLLPKLSPKASKIYLVLLAHLPPTQGPAIVQIPMNTLSKVSTLAPRTCAKALRELCALHLLRKLPHGYHEPRAYRFLPFHLSTDQPPRAGHIPSNQPPQAGHTQPAPTPTPATPPKTPNRPPQATLLNNTTPAPTQPPRAGHIPAGFITPAHLRALAERVPPEKRARILATAAALEAELARRASEAPPSGGHFPEPAPPQNHSPPCGGALSL